ncbi:MAG: cbb3-type cytochrome oxidase assembly protein CcoS [Candidatus Kapabacteria bacterium]|nr:cbb3-type cytochrome oxidase assembly protein CcoS [Candidatus Kapabacteria bacterium]
MDVIFLLIIISFTLAFGFLIAFIYAMKHDQFEDSVTPSLRILNDLDAHNKHIHHN